MTPGTQVDRYTVLRLLGEGGMARVYLVEHSTLHTQHALKVLNHTHPSVRERLVQESRVQARLRHPNVVAVTDVLEVEGQPALLMELVEGPTLELELWERKGTPMPLDEALELFDQVCSAVQAAHEEQVVHRDLKPANILLAPEGAKVSDFGLAKALAEGQGAGHTRTGSTMGTPAYMAPEQIRDTKNVDARADVFALGAILYELVCGVRAFQGEDVLELMNAVAKGDFVPPRERNPELPRRVARAIQAALVVDPELRVGSVTELRAAIKGELHLRPRPPAQLSPDGRGTVAPSTPKGPPPRALSSKPPAPATSSETIEIQPEEPPGPASKWPRRVAAGLGLSLLALVVGGVLVWEPPAEIGIETGNENENENENENDHDAAPAVVEPVKTPIQPKPAEKPLLAAPAEEPPSEKKAEVEADPSEEPPAIMPPVNARFSFTGADHVELNDGWIAHPPGGLPPGTYTVMATFGETQVSTGKVTLRAGQVVTVACDADFMTCATR